jgi:ribonucleotide monophosphatase NagD (HAD superfamily)
MRKLPAIISDIDGVLVQGLKAIKNSDKAINKIRSPLA